MGGYFCSPPKSQIETPPVTSHQTQRLFASCSLFGRDQEEADHKEVQTNMIAQVADPV